MTSTSSTDGSCDLRSGRAVDALYLRMDGELMDLTGTRRTHGRGGDLRCGRQGGVYLANAPGNGVADDKAVYCYVPELIEFYLGERPLLESVPTYHSDDEKERAGGSGTRRASSSPSRSTVREGEGC